MNEHCIISARYVEPNNTAPDAPVVAIHERYGEQWRRANDDIDGGGMLAYLAAGGTIDPYQAPPVTSAQVNAERDRRMATFRFNGKDFDFDPESQQNIAGATVLALAAIGDGAQPGDLRWANADQDFVWLAKDNSYVPMDAQTTLAFGQAGAAWQSALIFAARTIKDMDPIPADYETNAAYWPAAG